jgi:hypothetical protein
VDTLWEGKTVWTNKEKESVAIGMSEWMDGFRFKGVRPDTTDTNTLWSNLWVNLRDNRALSEKAFDYAGRLMQAARAIGDVNLKPEVKKADFLSHLVNLGGTYATFNLNTSSVLPTESCLSALSRGQNIQVGSDKLKAFLQNLGASNNQKTLMQFERKLLLSLPQIQQFQAGSKNAEFVDEMLVSGKQYTLLQNKWTSETPVIIDDLSAFMSDVWSAQRNAELSDVSSQMQYFLAQRNPVMLASNNLSAPISYTPYSTVQLRKERKSWDLALAGAGNYDSDILEFVREVYNPKLRRGLTVSGVQVMKPLNLSIDWLWIKSMIEGAETTNPNSDARKYDPMQIANNGDPALPTMKAWGEGTRYYLAAGVRDRLSTVIPTPFNSDWDYSGYPSRTPNQRMEARLSISAGIAWLISRGSNLDSAGRITSWDVNPQIGWKNAIIRYNGGRPELGELGGGNPHYWTDVSTYHDRLIDGNN